MEVHLYKPSVLFFNEYNKQKLVFLFKDIHMIRMYILSKYV